MKHCQNENCGAEISRETSLFCPYCGEYQSISGWHYHHQPLNRETGESLEQDIRFSRPYVFISGDPVRDCLADGNVLVVLGHDNVTAYNVETSINTRKLQQKWRVSVGDEAKIIILRPYVIIIESYRVRGVHLESEEEFDFLIFPDNPDYLPFKDSKIIISIERALEGKKEAVLILAVEKSILFLIFGKNNQISGHILKSIAFKSHILSLHTDSLTDNLLHVYSVFGEYVKIDIERCLLEQETGCVIPCDGDVFSSEERPAGGFSVEWAFTKKDATIFLTRKNTGESKLLKTKEGSTETITDKIFSRKNPSVSKDQPLILFESEEFRNQLVGYHLLDKFLKDYSLPTSKFFNIKIEEFETLPERILYFAGKYWAICPCDEPMVPYQLVSMSFDSSGSIDVKPELKIPVPDPNFSRDSFKVLPLLLNGRQLLSYIDRTIFVLF
jgi:hypothetical protein